MNLNELASKLADEMKVPLTMASKALAIRNNNVAFAKEWLLRKDLKDDDILTDNSRYPLWFAHLGKMR